MGKRLSMPPLCARCGKPDPKYGAYCKRCIAHKAWLEAIRHAWDPNQVRIDGVLYDIGPELKLDPRYPRQPRGGQGLGGRALTIMFRDGRVVRTRNLWEIGPIPKEYREALPDNADFFTEEGGALER